MLKKYIIRLSELEREHLQKTIKKLSGSGQKVCRDQILLKADADGPCWPDSKIAEKHSTVERKQLKTSDKGSF